MARKPQKKMEKLGMDAEKVQVHWGLPTLHRGDDAADNREAITRYAETLFGTPWAQLNIQDSTFRRPHVRTPYYQSKGKNLVPDRKSSQALCSLWNEVKLSTASALTEGHYTRHSLSSRLSEENAGLAIIASRSSDHPVLSVAEDYEVQVTVRPEGEDETTAHLYVLRRLPPVDPESEAMANDWDYFLQLPQGMHVTINGRTYINDSEPASSDGDGATGDFIIGPLIRFTVIELLSQPLFFFRSHDDLVNFKDRTGTMEVEKDSTPSESEYQNRSTYGDVPAQNVSITWTPRAASGKSPQTTEATVVPDIPAPEANTLDRTEIEPDLDACHVFRGLMKQLAGQALEPPPVWMSSITLDRQVYESIAAVASSMNELRPITQGFSVYGPNAFITSSGGAEHDGHDAVILRCYSTGDHIILLLVQYSEDAERSLPEVYAINSAPLTPEQRNSFHNFVRQTLHTRAVSTGAIRWIAGSGRSNVRHSRYFAVLTAWSILLGLPLNLTNFAPSESFFRDADRLLAAVIKGLAGWKLIWAFLRGNNYVVTGDPPARDRRFTKTFSPRQMSQYGARMARRPVAPEATAVGQDILYRHFTPNRTSAPDFEPVVEKDLPATVPGLKKNGVHMPEVAAEELRWSSVNLDPCKYFREALENLWQDKQVVSDLKDFRDVESVTQNYGDWLADDELPLYIAAVTLAITKHQQTFYPENGYGYGFAHATAVDVQASQVEVDLLPPTRTRRQGRPLLASVHINNHFVLLVAQLDNAGQPTVTILNSKSYCLDQEARRKLHASAVRLLKRIQWDPQGRAPKITSYIPVSEQPNEHECGYYTILNAWILALGLAVNPNVHVDWTDEFYNDLQAVLHLARMGKLDWSVIYAFLKCRNLVEEGVVPADRRFEQSVEIRKEADLSSAIDDLDAVEEVSAATEPARSLDQLKAANRCLLPEGTSYNAPGGFASDRWTAQEKLEARELARHGILNPNASRKGIMDAAETLKSIKSQEFRNQLQAADPNYLDQPYEHLVLACQTYIQKWHEGRLLAQAFRPDDTANDTLNFYKYLFRPDFLGDKLKTEAYSPIQKDLLANEVHLAISAVVEAVDRTQELHAPSDEPFTGGLSLVDFNMLQLALSGIDVSATVSRPRRCFLMPLTVARGGLLDAVDGWRAEKGIRAASDRGRAAGGHHLLAVLQEEKVNETSPATTTTTTPTPSPPSTFTLHLYDSAPQKLQNAYPFLTHRIQTAASLLSWSTHRNTLPPLTPWHPNTPTAVPTAPQPPGGWQCGPHTILTAWILALRLRPNPTAHYNTAIYTDFSLLARAACNGVLDCVTLVTWLVRHRLVLVVSGHGHGRGEFPVPLRYRFGFTRGWRGEGDVEGRVGEVNAGEGGGGLAVVPYGGCENPVHGVGGMGAVGLERAVEWDCEGDVEMGLDGDGDVEMGLYLDSDGDVDVDCAVEVGVQRGIGRDRLLFLEGF